MARPRSVLIEVLQREQKPSEAQRNWVGYLRSLPQPARRQKHFNRGSAIAFVIQFVSCGGAFPHSPCLVPVLAELCHVGAPKTINLARGTLASSQSSPTSDRGQTLRRPVKPDGAVCPLLDPNLLQNLRGCCARSPLAVPASRMARSIGSWVRGRDQACKFHWIQARKAPATWRRFVAPNGGIAPSPSRSQRRYLYRAPSGVTAKVSIDRSPRKPMGALCAGVPIKCRSPRKEVLFGHAVSQPRSQALACSKLPTECRARLPVTYRGLGEDFTWEWRRRPASFARAAARATGYLLTVRERTRGWQKAWWRTPIIARTSGRASE